MGTEPMADTTDSSEFWLQLRTKDSELGDRFYDVLEALAEVEEERGGIVTQLGTETPQGFVTMVQMVSDAAQLERWLNDLAAGLEEAGGSGGQSHAYLDDRKHRRGIGDLLRRWTITDFGHGRHLVEAPDLESWYRQPLPDPDTVARARHDFGDMILTQEVIDASPAPWDRM